MIDFIDKTSEQAGTPINRNNLMAMQGFVAKTITKNTDGSITETNADGHTLVTRKIGGIITEVFTGDKVISKTTQIVDGVIIEIIEDVEEGE